MAVITFTTSPFTDNQFLPCPVAAKASGFSRKCDGTVCPPAARLAAGKIAFSREAGSGRRLQTDSHLGFSSPLGRRFIVEEDLVHEIQGKSCNRGPIVMLMSSAGLVALLFKRYGLKRMP